MRKPPLSPTTLKRFPRYLVLARALQEQGSDYIKSADIARACDIQEILVRKDLLQTGVRGRQHCGYPIAALTKAIVNMIGWNRSRRAIIVGTGFFPRAIVRASAFKVGHIEFALATDVEVENVGGEIEGLEILPFEEACARVKEENVELAILSVPIERAQQATDGLVKAGIRTILNLTDACLTVPEAVRSVDADLAPFLATLCRDMTEKDARRAAGRK